MEFLYSIIAIVVLTAGVVIYWQINNKKKIQELFSEQKNFNVSHQYISDYSNTAIAVDSNARKIMFCENMVLTKINFDELISVDIQINDETLHSTKRGSQIASGAIGGLLLGPAGLLVGGLSGKTKAVQQVSKISIKATISNIDNPICEVIIYQGPPINADSWTHNSYSKDADEWIARLSVIISSQ